MRASSLPGLRSSQRERKELGSRTLHGSTPHTAGPQFSLLAVHCRAFAAHCRARRQRRGFRTAPSQVRPIAVTAVWVVSRGPEAKTSRPRQISNSSARLLPPQKMLDRASKIRHALCSCLCDNVPLTIWICRIWKSAHLPFAVPCLSEAVRTVSQDRQRELGQGEGPHPNRYAPAASGPETIIVLADLWVEATAKSTQSSLVLSPSPTGAGSSAPA